MFTDIQNQTSESQLIDKHLETASEEFPIYLSGDPVGISRAKDMLTKLSLKKVGYIFFLNGS